MKKTTGAVPSLTTEGCDDLLRRDLPPVTMVVGDVIPAGLLLLAGDPKAGKSLLAQDLALCIAAGTPAWGCLAVPQGSVLYLANEGGQRSFRARMEQMLGGEEAPTNLRIAYESEPLGARLEAQLDMWLTEHPDARLVVIDTYASVAPETRGVNRHQEDYNAMAGLADLANRWPETLFIVIHHTRKAEGEDVIHKISGSQGMTAATDGNAVLTRHTASRQCVLTIRPRNAEENELVIERGDNLRWSVVGDDERARLSGGRQRILRLLEQHPEGLAPKEVAEALDMPPASARQYLSQMAKARQVVKNQHGNYALPSVEVAA
jgi:DNA-binding transcriptional ArsR family regulator